MSDQERTVGDSAPPGRGVLQGAFVICDVLARSEDGLGLSELARGCGLPKATTYRLAEQLVAIGAVQRRHGRYAVGALLATLGRAWQPQPGLRRAATEPVRMLAALTATAVAVTVLVEGRVQVVTSLRGGVDELPQIQPGDDMPDRTAAGQVLLAAQPDREKPAVFSGEEWHRLRETLNKHGAIALDHAQVVPGVYCVAAPVRSPKGEVIASISALSLDRKLPAALSGLVPRAAQEISHNLGRGNRFLQAQ